jgi:hypothetical protein
MVYVNGKKFIIYDLDTKQTILERIASDMKTLPKYLYFESGIPDFTSLDDNNIVVKNMLNIFKGDIELDDFTDYVSKLNLNIKIEFPVLVSYYSDSLKVPEDMKSFILLAFYNEITDKYPEISVDDLNEMEKNKKITKDKLEQSIKNIHKKSEITTNMFNELQEAIIVPYTSFELEKTTLNIKIPITNISIIELFNYIHLNPRIPFASIDRFYKILKDFIPLIGWNFTFKDNIVSKINKYTEISQNTIDKDYIDVIMGIEGEMGNEVLNATLYSIESLSNMISKDEYIRSFMSIFPPEFNISRIEENQVNGVFYIYNQSFDKYVLSDLIMNNSLFSSMMSIDESIKATKSKNSLYIHLQNSKFGIVNFNLTDKIVELNDPNLRGKDKEKFKHGTSYIRVKVSLANNLYIVTEFQKMLGKLMTLYNKYYPIIIDIYRNFLPSFGKKDIKPKTTIKSLNLKDIAPDVFIAGYPQKCPEQPEIIDDDQVEEEKRKGKQVMVFPNTKDEGIPQNNYVCNHPEAKYPGIRLNPLANKELVPYLPCCYKQDHSTTSQLYRHYYYGEPLRDIQKIQQDFIKTNKFTKKDEYGYLPDEISKILDLYSVKGYQFLRKGVFDTKSSFLDCVIEAVSDSSHPIFKIDRKEQREKYLKKIRTEIATASFASVCKQEMYDFTTSEIIEKIQNHEVYLDPKYFIHLLEIYCNCNIYVFNRQELVVPRHIKSYYKTKNNKKCVFIYEHIGSKSDHAEYPRCELIVNWKIGEKTEPPKYNYENNSYICMGVNNIYINMIKSYRLNNTITETIFPLNNSIKIINQGIDSYGKCHMLVFRYKTITGTLLISPIQPLNIIEVKEWVVTPISPDFAIEIAKQLNMNIVKQNIVNDVAKSYSGKLGTVTVTIPITDSEPLDKIDMEEGINYPEVKLSFLNNYNKYKKLSRYITQYMLWLYSKFIHEYDRDINEESILNFTQDYIQIIPEYNYNIVNKTFDLESSLIKDGKLIIKSEETLKRLLYVLRISCMDINKIKSYHKRKVIDNYYSDITDFDTYQPQVILEGSESIDKWISEHKRSYTLYSKILPTQLLPYFFKNTLIGPKIWLAQNTFSIEKAIIIHNTWTEHNYNPGNDPPLKDEIPVNFTLYSYINEKNITKYNIGTTNSDINIIGYKIEGHSLFTVLLPLPENKLESSYSP